ncbi:peptidyl-prolyl cis-trans isomerase-related [Holotrichia oblita]|nr:peptidyl-prolyl cis-trans isomerase-related [Holotrichia oblita]
MGIITSVGNKYVKYLRELAKAKDDASCFIVEGKKQIGEITEAWDIQSFALSESFASENNLESYSQPARHFSGLHKKSRSFDVDFSKPGGLYLVCDRISDPGNMGTIIRNAHAFGCDALIISEGSVDIYNPKIIRASAGSVFKLNFMCGVDLKNQLKIFKSSGVKVITTHLGGNKLISEVDFIQKSAIIIGNEANGVSDYITAGSDELVKIPMPGNSESLNASVACGIVLVITMSEQNPTVTIEMESGDVMTLELYPKIAPNTVNNFISLVKKGYYDGLIFHRVINGFMIQGGCPDGIGTGNPGYSIKGEFKENGFPNDLAHTEGVISMARSNRPDSAGSQFFIMHKVSPHLDRKYAAFGKITEGMEVVNKIAEVETDFSDKPMIPQVICKMSVDEYGTEYPEPKVIA